jgi:hypothetical protein
MRPGKQGARIRSGGKPKFLLSGLLVCDTCGAHYIITDQRTYGGSDGGIHDAAEGSGSL